MTILDEIKEQIRQGKPLSVKHLRYIKSNPTQFRDTSFKPKQRAQIKRFNKPTAAGTPPTNLKSVSALARNKKVASKKYVKKTVAPVKKPVITPIKIPPKKPPVIKLPPKKPPVIKLPIKLPPKKPPVIKLPIKKK